MVGYISYVPIFFNHSGTGNGDPLLTLLALIGIALTLGYLMYILNSLMMLKKNTGGDF